MTDLDVSSYDDDTRKSLGIRKRVALRVRSAKRKSNIGRVVTPSTYSVSGKKKTKDKHGNVHRSCGRSCLTTKEGALVGEFMEHWENIFSPMFSVYSYHYFRPFCSLRLPRKSTKLCLTTTPVEDPASSWINRFSSHSAVSGRSMHYGCVGVSSVMMRPMCCTSHSPFWSIAAIRENISSDDCTFSKIPRSVSYSATVRMTSRASGYRESDLSFTSPWVTPVCRPRRCSALLEVTGSEPVSEKVKEYKDSLKLTNDQVALLENFTKKRKGY